MHPERSFGSGAYVMQIDSLLKEDLFMTMWLLLHVQCSQICIWVVQYVRPIFELYSVRSVFHSIKTIGLMLHFITENCN